MLGYYKQRQTLMENQTNKDRKDYPSDTNPEVQEGRDYSEYNHLSKEQQEAARLYHTELDTEAEFYRSKEYTERKIPEAVVKYMGYYPENVLLKGGAGNTGYDLTASIQEDILVPTLGRAIIPTGIFLEGQEGFDVQVRSKFGLARDHGIIVLNGPGTIDANFREEIQVLIYNTGSKPYLVKNNKK